MVLTNVLPRYGQREHQRLGILLVALLAFAVFMLMPSMAFAFDGTFKPDSATQTNVGTSFAACGASSLFLVCGSRWAGWCSPACSWVCAVGTSLWP